MTETQIHEIVTAQREYFYTGATLDIDFRINALKKLKAYVQSHESEIAKAIALDLGKSSFESYMCETGKLQEAIPLRCDSHHEPMELPIHAHDRASDRRYCSW